MRTRSALSSRSTRAVLSGGLGCAARAAWGRWLMLGACSVLAWGCGSAAGEPVLELVAASSLVELARDLGDEWTLRSGTPVRLRIGASSTLSRQLAAGAPCDVFLSADARWVDDLPALERKPWLGNRLALVVPTASSIAWTDESAPDVGALLSSCGSLALGQSSVPVGRYAEAALEALGVELPDRIVRGASARDVLSKVGQGAAQAGIVYATDVPLDQGVRLLALLPADSHPRVRYEAALLRPEARALFDALADDWVLGLATRYGFAEGVDK